jgi:meso-butanediol dehydrogenase/(S,S)-butanediol dehydrogenase/diacetyl reductase
MGRLEGRAIVVTGAGRGLGRAMMQRFVEEGAHVVAAARNSARLLAAVAPFGDKAMAVPADVGAPEDVERVFETVRTRFGRLDALINNAAVYDFFKFAEATPERIRRTVDSNILGPMLCTRAAIPLLRAAGGGDIVNVTSEAVRNPYPFLYGYASTKAALENFSQGLRSELRPDKIRVTALRLGGMDPSDNEQTMDPEAGARFMQEAAGALAYGGVTQMPFPSVVAAVLEILTMSAETTYDFVELRPTL